MSKNFRLNKIKKNGGIDTELFNSPLDAETAAYDLIDIFEADGESPYKSLVIRNEGNDILFKANVKEDETWKVLLNNTHDKKEDYKADDSIEVGSAEKSGSLDESYMVIIEDPEFDDCAPTYFGNTLAVDNVDADSVFDVCRDLTGRLYGNGERLGNYFYKDGDLCDDEIYGSCLDNCCADDMYEGSIYCLDDCMTQSPDEFFISKTNGEVQPQPVVIEEAAGESRKKGHKPHSLMPIIEKMPEEELTIGGRKYSFIMDDMQKVFDYLDFDAEDFEVWEEDEYPAMSSMRLMKAIKKSCGYTGELLSQATAAMVMLLEANGYFFNDIGEGKRPFLDRFMHNFSLRDELVADEDDYEEDEEN